MSLKTLVEIRKRATRTIQVHRGNNRLGWGFNYDKQKLGKWKQKNSPLFNMLSSQITPESSNRAQRLREGKERRGRERGNSRRVVKKESIIIQLLWPIDSQTNPHSAIHYLHTSLSVCFLFHIHTRTKIPTSKITCNTRLSREHRQRDQWDVLMDGDASMHTYTAIQRENTHICTYTVHKVHTTFIARQKSETKHPQRPHCWVHRQWAQKITGYGQAEGLKGYEDAFVLDFGIRRPVNHLG